MSRSGPRRVPLRAGVVVHLAHGASERVDHAVSARYESRGGRGLLTADAGGRRHEVLVLRDRSDRIVGEYPRERVREFDVGPPRETREPHGGTVEVRGAEGRGSTFVVRLPLDPAAPSP